MSVHRIAVTLDGETHWVTFRGMSRAQAEAMARQLGATR